MAHMLQDPLAQVDKHRFELIEEVPEQADQQHGAHVPGSTGSGRLPWG
jgi:hypothetical protein